MSEIKNYEKAEYSGLGNSLSDTIQRRWYESGRNNENAPQCETILEVC